MSEFLFILFSTLTVYGALVTVTHKDLVVCALHLAGSMLALAGLFFTMGAEFLAGVQVVVYAGAVMVLFVMVVMLFDLKNQSPKLFSKQLKPALLSLFFLMGLTMGALPLSLKLLKPKTLSTLQTTDTKALSHMLFTKYVFAFEVLGVLLLIIAVGVAVLCSAKKKPKANPLSPLKTKTISINTNNKQQQT